MHATRDLLLLCAGLSALCGATPLPVEHDWRAQRLMHPAPAQVAREARGPAVIHAGPGIAAVTGAALIALRHADDPPGHPTQLPAGEPPVEEASCE